MQDKSIFLIGKLSLEDRDIIHPVDLYIQNPYPNQEFIVYYIIFKINDNANFLNLDIEKFNYQSNWKKLAYRKGSSSGGDITFSTKLSKDKTEGKTQENINKKLKSWLNVFKRINNTSVDEDEKKDFLLIEKEFKEKREEIKTILYNEIKDEDKSKNFFISMKIIKNDIELFLYDYNVIKEIILSNSLKEKYNKYSTKSFAKNKISVIEKKQVDIVYGFAFPFGFSSVDKQGMVAGFFDVRNNWKNYPISKEAALILEKGKEFIEQNLVGYFWGHNYFIIPNPVLATDIENLKRIINRLKIALQEETKANRKAKAEENVMKIIAEEQNFFTVDLLFYEKNKSALRINMFIEEILPSRFYTLFIKTPNEVNKIKLFKNSIREKKNIYIYRDLLFNYGVVKTFFYNDFLDIVNKIFTGQHIDRSLLFSRFMSCYIKNYHKKKAKKQYEDLLLVIKKAFMIYYYLLELDLINYNSKNQINMNTTNNETKSRFELEKFQNFIQEHSRFFDSDIKIGLFALGILVRYIFDYQNKRLNSTPFENKLHAYKLNPRLIQNIYTESLEKLKQYGGFYIYNELRDIIAKNFAVNITDLSKLSNSEISFYFVTGIELGKEFKREDNNEN